MLLTSLSENWPLPVFGDQNMPYRSNRIIFCLLAPTSIYHFPFIYDEGTSFQDMEYVPRCNVLPSLTGHNRTFEPHAPFSIWGDRWRRLNGIIWFVIRRWSRLSFETNLADIYPSRFSHWPERKVEEKGYGWSTHLSSSTIWLGWLYCRIRPFPRFIQVKSLVGSKNFPSIIKLELFLATLPYLTGRKNMLEREGQLILNSCSCHFFSAELC